MKGRAFQSNFSMGILDEEFHGRVDMEIYPAAVAECANGLPAISGAVRRRAGFIDEGAQHANDRKGLLVPFRRSGGDQLQLEFGHLVMRIWEPDGTLRMNGLSPFVLTTPFAEADLPGLRWDQSNDVIYFTHKSREIRPYVLQRLGDLNWAINPLEIRNGPWRSENAEAFKTLTVSGLTGSVTVTASGHAPFSAAMIGEQLRIRTPDGQPSCSTWTPATDYKANELVQSDGKLYRAQNNDQKSGTAAPIHDSGAVSDGNLVWTFVSDGAGVVEITGYSSPTSVSGTVLRPLPGWTVNGDGKAICANPAAIPCGPTSRWAFGAWSDRFGWPGDVAVTDEERIAFSGSKSEPGRYHAGRAFGYGPGHVDMTPGLGSGRVTDDDAISRTVKGGADPIDWLVAGTALMFGTATREGLIQGETLEEGLTPAGNRPRALQMVGSSDVRPTLAHSGVVFVVRGGRGLAYLGVEIDQSIRDNDLSLFVEDLVADRIVGVVWASNPDRVAWCWTASGLLLSCTFQPRQNQWGWACHPLPGGFLVDSASVITDGDGRDVLWLAVRRTKGEAVQRRIWRQAARWQGGRRGVGADPKDRIIYLDACRLFTGEATAAIGGLDHLVGETVRVFGNEGALIFDAVVSEAGQISAPEGQLLTKACVGLRYLFEVEGLPLDVGGPGNSLGMKQRVLDVTIYVADCVELQAGMVGGPAEDQGGKPWGDNPSPIAQVFKCPTGGDTSRNARWFIRTDDCWPATLRAVRATVAADD